MDRKEDSINTHRTDESVNEENLMRFESHRLETFQRWPPSAPVGAGKIARAGFYYTGSYLEVKCTWCGLTLTSWEYGDQVMGRHRRAHPSCPFVLNLSNNVPLATSPQPPQMKVTSQSSQINPVDVTGSSEAITGQLNSISTPVEQLHHPEQLHHSEQPHHSEQLHHPEPQQPEDQQQSQEPGTSQDVNSIEGQLNFDSTEESGLVVTLSSEENRLKTFQHWPLPYICPQDLAKAGFTYVGCDDCVRCVFCHGFVSSWEETDQPDTVHAELFPHCPFVKGLDCGNVPITDQQRQQVLQLMQNPDVGETHTSDNHDLDDYLDATRGSDETGFRIPAGRDLNSGPERGPSVLTLKDPSQTGQVDEMMGVIKHSGPAHPKYATLEGRLRTFREWPPALKQQPREFAEAGFYYIGMSDQVKCFYCDGGLKNWQPEDDPWVEHARWFSKCGFIRLVKGDEFIAECIVSRPPEAIPEIPSSSENHFQMTEETMEAMMLSIQVQEALSHGIDPSRIRMAFKKKWEETGSGFSGSQNLVEALSNNSTGATNLVSPTSPTPSSSRPPLETQSTLQASLPNAERSTTLSVSSPSQEKLPSPSIPDRGCQSEDEPKPTTTSSIDLEKENRRLKEERTCKICMDHEIGVVFLPCGHLICCNQCAPALTNCPLCRQAIHGTVKTYMS